MARERLGRIELLRSVIDHLTMALEECQRALAIAEEEARVELQDNDASPQSGRD